MLIEVNPKSLKNLEQICEVLYCLHPSVLDYMTNELIDDNEILLGEVNLRNPTFKERELLTNLNQKDNVNHFRVEKPEENKLPFKAIVNWLHCDGEYPEKIFVFKRLLKYLQLDTYDYIPIKFYVEVEDPVIRKKVRKLVSFLEKTNAPEQFYLHKREEDTDAYFAEGYGLTMNEEQKKKKEDLFLNHDPEKLKKLLIKEKLYYY